MNGKNNKYHDELEQIEWTQEEGYAELEEIKKNEYPKEATDIWGSAVDKYLDSIEYAVDKSNRTSKKISHVLDQIPEPVSKRAIQITFVLLFFAILIFFIT